MVHPLVALLVESRSRQSSDDAVTAQKAGVLDLRRTDLLSPQDLASTTYIPGALRIPDGIAGLDDRYSWLPPPSRKPNKSKSVETKPSQSKPGLVASDHAVPTCHLVVLCDAEERDAVSHALDRWDVAGFVCASASDTFWCDAEKAGLVTSETSTLPLLLFEPSPIVPILVDLWQNRGQQHSATLLDLGCGAGRDVAWIVRWSQSRESRCTWRATALDNLPSTIRRVRLLASETGLQSADMDAPCIEATVLAATTSDGTVRSVREGNGKHEISLNGRGQSAVASLRTCAAEHLPHRTYDVILLVRFWPIALLHNLHVLTRSGSMIVLSHFTTVDAQQDESLLGTQIFKTDFMPAASKRFERRQIDELISAWQSATDAKWTIVHHSISGSEDGRPLRHVIIQREPS